MNKDGCYTQLHMHHPRNADLFEDVCKDRLPNDDIFVPPQHQPINPEDEDDVVPDQHAAFGIQRATQAVKEPAWKDLGLAELMRRGPGGNDGGGGNASGLGLPGSGNALGNGGSNYTGNSYGYYAYYYSYNENDVVNAATGGGDTAGGNNNNNNNNNSSSGVSGSGAAGAANSSSRGAQAGPSGRGYRGLPR